MTKRLRPLSFTAIALLAGTQMSMGQECVFTDPFDDNASAPNWTIRNSSSSYMQINESSGRLQCSAPTNNVGFDLMSRCESSDWYIDMTTSWAVSMQLRIQPTTPTFGEIGFGFALVYEPAGTSGYINDGIAISSGTYNYGDGVVNFEATRFWRDGAGQNLTLNARTYVNTTMYVWYDVATDVLSYGPVLQGTPTQAIASISTLSSLTYAHLGFMGYSLYNVPASSGSQLWADDFCLVYGNLVGPLTGACCVEGVCVQTLESACDGSWQGAGTTCDSIEPCEVPPLLVPEDYPTIAEAIAAANEGDEIIVSAGTHYGTGSAVVDPIGKTLLIRSADGPATTFLDGQGERRVVLCDSNESSKTIIQGFTIMNGQSDARGGGILIQYDSNPVFENCVIQNCSALQGGGCAILEATPAFVGCSFLENESLAEGAALDAAGESIITLTDCTVALNTAGADVGFAAINIRDTSIATLSGTTVCDNSPNEIIGAWVDQGDNSICDGCVTDLTGDGAIDGGDLTVVLGYWGECPDPKDCLADLNGDGFVNGADLTVILGFWGPCP